MRVFLAGTYSPVLMLRQTPGGQGVWQSLRFCTEDPEGSADWLAVMDEPRGLIHTTIPRERRILFVTEPDDFKSYPLSYLNHFGAVVSPTKLPGYEGRHIKQQPGLPWWLGAGDYSAHRNAPLYEELLKMQPPEKIFPLSVICSTKRQLKGHRKRVEFVKYAKKYFGDELHWFGRGLREIDDKQEAILPYRYHIVLENNFIDHFWTEKLADSYLGYAFPLYSGCKNIGDYFPEKSFMQIDIGDPKGAVRIIKSVLSTDPWNARIDLLKEAREKLLREHNFFNLCETIVREVEATQPRAEALPFAEIIQPIPPLTRPNVKRWVKSKRKKLQSALRQWGLLPPKKDKWKKYAETAVPFERLE